VGYQEFPLPLFFPLSLSLSLPLTLSPPLSLSPSTGRRSPTRTRYGRSTVNRVGVSSVCPFSNPVSYRHERRNSHHNCAHWEEEQQQHPSTTRRTTLSLYRRWLPSGSSLFFLVWSLGPCSQDSHHIIRGKRGVLKEQATNTPPRPMRLCEAPTRWVLWISLMRHHTVLLGAERESRDKR
jgi:hypothetical protein